MIEDKSRKGSIGNSDNAKPSKIEDLFGSLSFNNKDKDSSSYSISFNMKRQSKPYFDTSNTQYANRVIQNIGTLRHLNIMGNTKGKSFDGLEKSQSKQKILNHINRKSSTSTIVQEKNRNPDRNGRINTESAVERELKKSFSNYQYTNASSKKKPQASVRLQFSTDYPSGLDSAFGKKNSSKKKASDSIKKDVGIQDKLDKKIGLSRSRSSLFIKNISSNDKSQMMISEILPLNVLEDAIKHLETNEKIPTTAK